MDVRLLREGLCPHGHGPLDRRDDYGWCAECGTGWSMQDTTVRVHVEIDVRPLQKAIEKTTEDVVAFERQHLDRWSELTT